MGLIDTLTPDHTEEVKPGLFIQKKGKRYRHIEPMAWNGKIRWKEQLSTVFSIRTFVTLGIILFLVFGYLNDTGELLEFHNMVMTDPLAFCRDVETTLTMPDCTPTLRAAGLCVIFNPEVEYEGTNNVSDSS